MILCARSLVGIAGVGCGDLAESTRAVDAEEVDLRAASWARTEVAGSMEMPRVMSPDGVPLGCGGWSSSVISSSPASPFT